MKMIVKMVFGSHMYGLDTPNSDLDYKGIYLPELNDLLLGTHAKHIDRSTGDDESKNGAEDIDDSLYSLDEFMKLALKGETVALDMLHVNPELVSVEIDPAYGWIWEDLVANREKLYTKNLKAYMGYVKRQAAKYGLKGSRISAMRKVIAELSQHTNRELELRDIWENLPEGEYTNRIEIARKDAGVDTFYEVNGKKYQNTNKVDYVIERVQIALDSYGSRAMLAEKNEGVDWKAVSHALRAGYQLRSILANGTFTYPLAETEFLANVKAGTVDYKSEVSPVLESLVEEIEQMTADSDLPDNVDAPFWKRWLLDTYTVALINPVYQGS